MALKDIVENNPALLSLSLLLAGFIAGITTYDAILRIAHLETVATAHLSEEEQTLARLRQEQIESAEKLSVATIENRDLSDQIETDKRLLSSKMLAQLDGVWVNQNQSTPSITHFRIERRGSDVFVHAWGACHPTDCDWGEQRALVDQDSALVLWDQGFVFRKMVIRLNKRTDLTADDLSIFTDNSGRAKYEKVEVFSYKQDSNSAIAGSSTSSPTSPPVGTAGRVIR